MSELDRPGLVNIMELAIFDVQPTWISSTSAEFPCVCSARANCLYQLFRPGPVHCMAVAISAEQTRAGTLYNKYHHPGSFTRREYL